MYVRFDLFSLSSRIASLILVSIFGYPIFTVIVNTYVLFFLLMPSSFMYFTCLFVKCYVRIISRFLLAYNTILCCGCVGVNRFYSLICQFAFILTFFPIVTFYLSFFQCLNIIKSDVLFEYSLRQRPRQCLNQRCISHCLCQRKKREHKRVKKLKESEERTVSEI